MKIIVLSGRLTADPEIKEVGDKGVKVANFTIANNDRDGSDGEFFDVSCWDRTAEFVENYVKKGQRVIVHGTFQNDVYKDKEGATRHRFRITAHNIEFGG
ncbi:MAG: single-stranded DNA-binding protein [Clostridia bacterium]|nr:single-stranded DNA-binding protein [Clostridia bacterium]